MLSVKQYSLLAMVCLSICCADTVWAHFGMVIPLDSMVMQEDAHHIQVDFSFSHPMEMIGMDLERPKVAHVMANGKQIDVVQKLQPLKVMDRPGWRLDHKINRPGVYVVYMEPQPYWEPTEDAFIVHYTKTVVTAFGDDEGWDAEVGLKTEIVPLTKPFGLYAGNVFQGVVKLNGKPVPYSTVEIEYYNQQRTALAPTDYMVTQTIKADANGVFTYAVPESGWWGFAALNPSDQKKKFQGKDKDVELGAVIWVKFHPWKEKTQ